MAVMPRNTAAPAVPLSSELASLIEDLRFDPRLGPQLLYEAYLPATEAVYGELDPPLPEPIARALGRGGVPRLWRHQTEGIAAVRRGENVLVTTPTASGKSLIFQVPALEAATRGEPGHGLFLFPLKALGQDQRGKFLHLAQEAGLGPDVAGCEIYDGDTPASKRLAIRKNFPRVVISNPDMLHLGVLGHWTAWGPFLADLRWIVLDELHTYRGIFGSHFHHVLQRFLRLCRSLGSDPVLIASSATAANAGEFAETLAGRPFHWIRESGAPREGRHLLLYRPEGSPYTTALQLFVRLVNVGLKTIVFTKARRVTELLYSWLRRQEPALALRVASYRAGFLAEERRRIERALFEGKLDGVISTSALEMGIDVGGLDACILVGYPGSMMATWQRSGRVGRDGRDSITALVAMPDALDQYFLDHPQEFLERPCERLIVDPENDPVSRGHLVCAAAEMPLSGEDRSYLARHGARVEKLLDQGHLLAAADGDEIFCLRRRPQRFINLRGTGETFAILAGGRTIGTVDGVRVLHECHPGAVYLHAGRQYLVEALEREERRVQAVAADLDYFTTPLTEKETEILEVLETRHDGPLQAWLGRLKVTERVVGFERKRIYGQETIDQTPLDLPPVEFETVGLWWAAPRAIEETLRRQGEHFLGSLHASEHAGISLFPILALCDRGDIGGISYPLHPQLGCGAVFIYDGHPGGVGIAARGFADLRDLLGRVRLLVEGCPCETGCPSCVQSPKCGNGNRPLDKPGAARALRLLLGLEEPAVAWGEAVRIQLASPIPDPHPLAPSPAPSLSTSPGEGEEKGNSSLLSPSLPLKERGQGSEGFAGMPIPAQPSLFQRAFSFFFRKEPAREREPRTVLFDLETLRSASEVGGWGQAHRMGVAVGVVCHLEEGRFEVFSEPQVRSLVDTLKAASLVVGYNVRRFDYQVLAGYTGENYARLLPTLDLLEHVHSRLGFRVGMGHLAQETLGTTKSADGLQSLEWVRQGRLDLVEQYCRRDVEILRDLYVHGRREGFLLYRDRRRDLTLKLRVGW
ncbi:MAG TPA: DEAD/DEAH box helicase [Thermoanaerobaculia bacterium]|jgi:DEAD/DEAH box helicase domain-containing protein|nr:DEAD/DEAH box helicase [Thermoanaerobaculia bacterium]